MKNLNPIHRKLFIAIFATGIKQSEQTRNVICHFSNFDMGLYVLTKKFHVLREFLTINDTNRF